MAQSHIKLQGGLGDGRSLRATITQSNHGFVAGQALRFNRKTATGAGDNKYYAALADNTVNSEVVGVIESATTDNFDIVYGGEISLAGACGGAFGFGDDDVFFLSGNTSGLLTNVPPTEAGSVIKPVIVRIGGPGKEEIGIVTNYIGTVIGGTSTVTLNSIQPVGTIEPFAGTSGDVPESWSMCDGGPLDVTEYPELYTRVGNHYGYHVKITNSAISSATGIAVGQRVKQGDAISGIIVSVNSGAGEIEVDVDHLSINSDGTFTPHNNTWATGPTSPEIDIPGDTPSAATNTTGSIQTQVNGPDTSINLTANDTTVTTVKFRKPDLRGKFVIGTASQSDNSTAIAIPNNFERGQYGGQYSVSAGTDTGTIAADPDGTAVDNVPPYQAFNYLIKISATEKAALLDNIVAGFGISDLVDVDAPAASAQSGDVLIFDAASTNGAKYRPFRLFTDYPDNQSIVQITVDNVNSNNIVNFGNTNQSNAFTVDVSGIRPNDSSASFVVRDGASSTDIMTVKKTSSGGAVGIQTSPSDDAALKLGAKGLLFSSGSNTVITGVDTTVGSVGSDNKLVSEKAVRTAINNIEPGRYGKSTINAKSNAFFYSSSSGGSQIKANSKNKNYFYQAGQGLPIMVVLMFNPSEDQASILSVTYTDPNGNTVNVGALNKGGNNGHAYMQQMTFAMYPGSKFYIPNTQFGINSVSVLKQD